MVQCSDNVDQRGKQDLCSGAIAVSFVVQATSGRVVQKIAARVDRIPSHIRPKFAAVNTDRRAAQQSREDGRIQGSVRPAAVREDPQSVR